MTKQLPAVVVAALVVAALATLLATGLAPAASAGAATAPAASPAASRALPNPCKTFTDRSADALLGVRRGARLTETPGSSTKPYPRRTCVVRHAAIRMAVVVQRYPAGKVTGPYSCRRRPGLGSHGVVCVSRKKSLHSTIAVFRKRGVWVGDGISLTLPRHGRRLYDFALAQRKAVRA